MNKNQNIQEDLSVQLQKTNFSGFRYTNFMPIKVRI